MRARLGAVVSVVLLSVGLVGCTSDDEDPGPQTVGSSGSSSTSAAAESSESPSSTAPTTAPKPEQTFPPEQQPIVDVYWGYYDALYSLKTQTDEQVRAALSPYAVELVVEHVVSLFSGLRAEGKEPGGHPTYGELTIESDGATATVRECRDSSTETIVDISTGQVLETGAAGLSARTDFTYVTDSKTWRIANTYATPGAC